MLKPTAGWTSGALRMGVAAGVAMFGLASVASAAPGDPPLTGEEILKLVAISGGLVVAAIAIIFGSVRSMVKGKELEQTKRELAAYVAEGSMNPEDAERILQADQPIWAKDRKSCGKRG